MHDRSTTTSVAGAGTIGARDGAERWALSRSILELGRQALDVGSAAYATRHRRATPLVDADRPATDRQAARRARDLATALDTVAGSGETIRVCDASSDAPPESGRSGASFTLLGVPLRAGGEVVGAVCFEGFRTGTVTDADQLLGEQVARSLELAIRCEDRRRQDLVDAVVSDEVRIAAELSDTVIHSLFAVGLALSRTAGMSDEPGTVAMIEQQVAALDDVIGDLRTAVFDLRTARPAPPSVATDARRSLRRS